MGFAKYLENPALLGGSGVKNPVKPLHKSDFRTFEPESQHPSVQFPLGFCKNVDIFVLYGQMNLEKPVLEVQNLTGTHQIPDFHTFHPQ